MKPVPLNRLGLNTAAGYINTGSTCWICPTTHGLEDHHIVPRHCGGENGPQVTICGVCHTAIHNLALSKHLNEPHIKAGNVLTYNHGWTTLVMLQKAYSLAWMIRKATDATRGDTNRKVKFSTTFDGATSRKLKDLVRAHPEITSQDQMITILIKQAHARLFRG